MPIPVSPMFERVLLRDRVADQLREAIVEGVLQPGEVLSDDALIAWLHVSRTPIREGISQLVAEGLIEMVPNRYTRVALPDPAEAIDVLRTIGFLMASVTREVVPVLGDAERKVFLERIDEKIEKAERGDVRGVVERSSAAYEAWLDACPNTVLATVIRRSIAGLTLRTRHDPRPAELRAVPIHQGLSMLRAAVADGDADLAGRAAEVMHLLRAP